MVRWYPHTFENNAIKLNYNSDYIQTVLNYGNNIRIKNIPIIFSLAHLSKITDISYPKLKSIIRRDLDAYVEFNIKKRSGGFRKIVVPNYPLMKTQQWINQNILSKGLVHSSAYAYVKGKSIKQNAEIHCGAKWLIKMDIQRFFEAISERKVYRVFRKFGYTKLLSFELTRICTRNSLHHKQSKSKRWTREEKKGYYNFYDYPLLGYLPQGTPTSPALANLVFYELDEKIIKIAKEYGCIYTRYSDDLTFSSNHLDRDKATELISKITTLLSKNGFTRNFQKTKILPPGAKKIVTGLIVNSDKPKVKKELKDRIETHLYYSKKYGVANHCTRRKFKSLLGFLNHLEGLINYVKFIDNDLGCKYYEDFKIISDDVLKI